MTDNIWDETETTEAVETNETETVLDRPKQSNRKHSSRGRGRPRSSVSHLSEETQLAIKAMLLDDQHKKLLIDALGIEGDDPFQFVSTVLLKRDEMIEAGNWLVEMYTHSLTEDAGIAVAVAVSQTGMTDPETIVRASALLVPLVPGSPVIRKMDVSKSLLPLTHAILKMTPDTVTTIDAIVETLKG